MPACLKTTPLLSLAAAFGMTLTGCQFADEARDIEMARGEARYVPVELVGTLALGVMRAADYGTYSSVVHQSYSAGDPITSDGCASVALVDGMGTDGEGTVFYDFGGCADRAGQVQVTQRVVSGDEARDADFPGDGWEDSDGDGIPDSLPPGSEDLDLDGLSEEDLAELLGGDADIDVAYAGYREGLLAMEGSLSMSASLGSDGEISGPLSADIGIEAWNYSGEASVEGEWKHGSLENSRSLSFTGGFVSSTGLNWTVMASNVELSAGCVDATAGEITAVFENGLGDVTVTAKFDSVCDGCANIFIDGESAGRVCLPDEVQL